VRRYTSRGEPICKCLQLLGSQVLKARERVPNVPIHGSTMVVIRRLVCRM